MTALLAALQSQRRHVLGILEGLDDSALRKSVLPSGWTCLGLLNHLAVDVERFWFGYVVAGRRYPGSLNAWQVSPQTPAESIFDLYRGEIASADAILSASTLDATPRWWPDFFDDFRLDTVEEVLLHVITETACHAGHLDAVRELLDGKQWMVNT